MRRSKAEVDRYISSVQSSSPSLKEKPIKGFLFAKLYFEAKEYELAKRHVSEYLKVQERDPKAHKFLGQLYEKDGDINKAVGCYKRSVDLNSGQKDLVLRVAELLCSKEECAGRAEFWVERAAKLMPGHPAVFNLKERLLSRQGQQGWNRLFNLLQEELSARPADAHVNVKLVQLYSQDGRLDEGVKHCLATEKKGLLRHSLDWYTTVIQTLQEYLAQPSVSTNEMMCRCLQRELLLAHCGLLRLTLSGKGVQSSLDALKSFDQAMQSLSRVAGSQTDELTEVFVEMRGHLYLHAGTLLLKMAQEREQQWRAVADLAALCYLLAYQVLRPKAKMTKGEQSAPPLLELLASDRQSQAGHMLLNLSTDTHALVREVVEAFGNRSGQGSLFELLFGPQAPAGPSFIANDDIRSINTQVPELSLLAKCDTGSILLHFGDLQHLSWLGLQWTMLGQRPALREWLKQLFPRLTLETSKLDTNAPESICLLDLEVFVCGVVFCSHCQLQETAKINSGGQQQLHEPRCLPLPLLRLLSTDRQREWWDAVYSLIHKRALPGMSAKLRAIMQHGLTPLRAGEKHGLQPALAIHWAQHLSQTGVGVNSYYDQKEYIERSVHYWLAVRPLLEKIKHRRSIPEPLDLLFIHFPSRDIQISAVKGYEQEAIIAIATLLDIEGKTEEAVTTLETINNTSSNWHLARIFQRLSEEAGNGVEETQDRCVMFLRKFKTHLSKIYNANADEIEKLPVSMEQVMDLLNEVNQQLGEGGDAMDEEEEEGGGAPATSIPTQLTETAASISHIMFSSPSPNKSIVSPSKRHLISPKTPPHWVEDQKTLLQMLCQQVEALKNEVHDLRQNSSENTGSPHHRMYGESYGAEGLQETYPPAQSFHGAPLTVATQYLLRTAANVTPTKGPMYGMNRIPPQQQHMYAYQPPTQTPPLPTAPACIYPPQDQVFGPPLRFESPATSLLSPYSEEYYGHGVTQLTTNPSLPEPGYFTKPSVVPVQPPKNIEGKPIDFGKISFGQQAPAEAPKVPSFGVGIVAQSTPSSSFKFNSNFKSNDGDFTLPGGSQAKHSESLLGLLTSDIPSKTDGPPEQRPPAHDQPPSQSSIFTFGSKNAPGFSFADTAPTPVPTGLFANVEQPFNFGDMTKPIGFGATKPADEEKVAESDNESVHVEEEDGPHFDPIVPLPDKVDVKTGEEEEEEMFCNRAKLFRFDAEAKEWKERGIGNLKILKHSTSGKVRLLMRREQVLKICANHYINADMLLKPNAGSDKSWVWTAIDCTDEHPRPEQLAIRFKTADEATLFQTKFEEAQKVVPMSPDKHDQPEKSKSSPKPAEPPATTFRDLFSLKDGEWDCSVCCVRNRELAMQCMACESANPNYSSSSESNVASENKGLTGGTPSAGGVSFTFGTDASKSSSSGSTFTGFGAIGSSIPSSFSSSPKPAEPPATTFRDPFSLQDGEWDCSVCCVRNQELAMQCMACESANPNYSSSSESNVASENKGLTGGTPSAGGVSFTFGTDASKSSFTFATDASKSSSSGSTFTGFGSVGSSIPSSFSFGTGSTTSATAETADKPPITALGSAFGAQFGKKPGQWDCDTCAVRNEASADSCASCQTPNPSAETAVTAAATAAVAAPVETKTPTPAFGAQFGMKPGQWACQTLNPSAKSTMDVPAEPKQSTISSGSGFGAAFVKKDGQWDCGTCCVRNDASANSCVSCQTPNPSAKSTMDVPAEPKQSTISSGSGFGAAFVKKDGQWDCGTCCVRNDASANSCVSCQTPNPSAKSTMDVPAEPKQSTISSGSGFGAAFVKKDGQWDCGTCCVRNDASANSCVSCQTPNPSAKATVDVPAKSKPSTMSSGSGFGAAFVKKDGQWDCGTCCVRNDASANSCVSCQTPNPSAKATVDVPAKSKPSTMSSGSGFGAAFVKKDGQWDCGTCCVRNDSSANSCVSCQTPNPSAKATVDVPAKSKPSTMSSGSGFGAAFAKKGGQWDCGTCCVRNEASASNCVSCQNPCPNPSLSAMFAKTEGQWDCDACLVRNDSSANQCVSCQTPNPNAKNVASAAPSSSSFSFSFGSKSSSSQPAETGFTAAFGTGSPFSFGLSKDKPSAASFKFEAPPFGSSTSSAPGFAFPVPPGGFKFGTQDTETETPAADDQTPASGSASMFLKNIADQHREKEKESSITTSTSSVDQTAEDQNPLFTGKPNTFSFADLAQTTGEDFQFGQTDSEFKGFSRAGEQLFPSLQATPNKADTADQGEEDMYKTEENDDIQFEPVVPMPDKVDLVTGEEDEQALYSQRVKLFRFDPTINQWKERGVGILKFLKNATNGRLRVLMRREQVLKVCANHWITTTMNLKPLAGSDKAWMWLSNDFSDGDARLEQLAAKFKTPELAEEFKLKFEECQRLLLDIPLQTPHKLVDTGRTAHLIQKAEEMKSGLKDLKSFLTDDKTKIKEDDRQVDVTTASSVSGLVIKAHADSTGPTLEWDNYDLREEFLDDTADTSVYASPLASSPVRKNLFRFGESTGGFNFSFQPIISPSKSPTKLNQSRASVGTDDEQDVTQDEEKDGQYFEPVVPLPDLVELSNGEENEQVVFSHRAKLYRYDKNLAQWKERGIGDLKLLQNYDTKRVRLIMRRDQVLKICANHWITSAIKLEPMKGSEKAWVWSAMDFAEETEATVEQLAVRFKLLDVANTFKEVFEQAKNAQEKGVLLTPVTSRVATPQEAGVSESVMSTITTPTTATAVCGQAAIAILEETTKECTELSPDTFHTPDSENSGAALHSQSGTSKMVMSPPKFVFGTENLQKIFGTPKSSPEPEDSSSSSKARDSGRPASTTPAFRIPEKAPPQEEGGSADSEVEIVYVREPTTEQAALARDLLLPLTFFCYQNQPGYISDDQTDDEDFESAVKALNGKLYADPPERRVAASSDDSQAVEAVDPDECQVVWEKKPTPEEEEKAKSLQLPPHFFCGISTSDSEADKDKPEDFETEVRKAHEALDAQLSTEATISSTSTEAPEEPTSGQGSGSTEAVAVSTTVEEQTSDQQSSSTEAVVDSSTAEEQTSDQASCNTEAVVDSSTAEEQTSDQASCNTEAVADTSTAEEQTSDQGSSSTEVVADSSTAEEQTSDQGTSSTEAVADTSTAEEQTSDQGSSSTDAVVDSSTAEQTSGQVSGITDAVADSSTAEQTSGQVSGITDAVVDSSTAEQTSGQVSGITDAVADSSTAEQTSGQVSGITDAVVDSSTAEQTSDQGSSSTEVVADSSTAEQTSGQVSGITDAVVDSSTAEQTSGQVFGITDAVVDSSTAEEQTPDQSAETQIEAPSSSSPIDLSTKKSPEPDSTTVTTTSQDDSFGFFNTLGGSFAELANTTGDYAFGQIDSNFSWANAGASVFGAGLSSAAPKNDGDAQGSDGEEANNEDIHFEPIVSLPEVETKSGEEDEEILFKERTKLYRWDRELNQWKERGVGDIKILFHPANRFYRVLMRREQVLRVCANHTICPTMDLKPMNTSAYALIWTATDHAEGEGKVEQLAAKFKTPELAESFRKTFCECQVRMGQLEGDASFSPQMSKVQEHSRDTNPRVFLNVAADGEALGTVTVELFSHIVPKTAENFRVLCTGERGFGLRDSIFHRVVTDFMCQGGDITKHDGTGGKSIYGGKFEDENFDVRHTGPGLLSMANRGRDTNNSQFFITLKKAEHLDFKHVAFGWVRDGMDVVRRMGELGTKTGKPSKKIIITDCGQL